ncbi:MAG: TIGR04283 family arsenosugar biosynthesis glycosyltransferase [Balneolaceae bacterium]
MISVVIPALNEADNLKKLLPYLQAHAGPGNLELIIADGGSTDASAQIAEQNGAIFHRCSQKGRARQMNEGAARASGDILYFLHADTYPPHHFSADIRGAVSCGIDAGCYRLAFDDSHRALRFFGWCTRFDITLFRYGDQSLFVRRSLFEQSGRYRDDLIVMEDQEIVSRLKKIGAFQVLEKAVQTSARKYRDNGVMKLQSVFALITLLYYAGVKQNTLVHLYKELIKM